MLVVAPPSQRTCFRHRLAQLSQTWAEIPPQGKPFEHATGQLTVPPQPSPMSPQYCCTPLASLQVIFTQSAPPTQAFWPPHTQPLPAAEQSAPQSSELPQPSPMVPQYWPPVAGSQVSGVQAGGWPLQRLSWQVQPVLLHVVPQFSELPQPSPMIPQYWSPLAVAQVREVQPAVGPARHRLSWQVQPVFVHAVPQSTELPQPSPMVPQYWSLFAVVQACGTQLAVGPALHKLSWQIQPAFAHVVWQFSELPQPSPMVPQY
jgi:hypothetical protein